VACKAVTTLHTFAETLLTRLTRLLRMNLDPTRMPLRRPPCSLDTAGESALVVCLVVCACRYATSYKAVEVERVCSLVK
jgi:hypothetical protein